METNTNPVLRWRQLLYAAMIAVACGWLFYTVYTNATTEESAHPFKLGLDLAGGSHLVYEADVAGVDEAEVEEAMAVLKTVIERRVNIFGVSEPLVQVEAGSMITGDKAQRLVVELPGVTDINEAVRQIGETPVLEFKLVDEEALLARELEATLASTTSENGAGLVIDNVSTGNGTSSEPYIATGLTGRYLADANLDFVGQSQGVSSGMPVVSLTFNDEGAALFEQITRDNVGRQLAIFLDGEMVSAPNINEPIAGGQAVISGGFTVDEAKLLAQNLKFGALPVPIELVSTQTIDATLGAGVLEKGIVAGLVGVLIVSLFMVLWYRAPGVVAVVALFVYVLCMLALFQYVPVTLTAAGLAGFILSLGMAVDANVLVFERMKEELRRGQASHKAVQVGFARAWSAIRDGNVTSLLSAIILFWFGSSLVKGFALVFGLGIIVSMVTILLVSRTLLLTFPNVGNERKYWKFLLGSGFLR